VGNEKALRKNGARLIQKITQLAFLASEQTER
jgi:hypothetical protein